MTIEVGDLVIPYEGHAENGEWTVPYGAWPPARVKYVFKNGRIRAYGLDGRSRWDGPADEFEVVEFVQDRYATCAFPMRPDAIAMSDCCRARADTAVVYTMWDGEKRFYWRCPEHRGLFDDGSRGRPTQYVPRSKA